MTSAKVRSNFRKYHVPEKQRMKVRAIEIKRPGQKSGASPFSNAHRKPSITPTMGFREYKSRHCSGTTELLKPTGEMYSPNCTMNGTMKRKSRYSTVNVHSHNPAPMATPNASAMKSGKDRIRQSGQYL